MNRPHVCTQELLARLCARVAAGEPLQAICRDPRMPSYIRFVEWFESTETVRAAVRRAWAVAAELLIDEVVAIADDVENRRTLAAARLRIEARQWALAQRTARLKERRAVDAQAGAESRDDAKAVDAVKPTRVVH